MSIIGVSFPSGRVVVEVERFITMRNITCGEGIHTSVTVFALQILLLVLLVLIGNHKHGGI